MALSTRLGRPALPDDPHRPPGQKDCTCDVRRPAPCAGHSTVDSTPEKAPGSTRSRRSSVEAG